MVLATRDKRSRRVVAADGRIKFHSKERGNAGMYWDQWENMSPTEQQWYRQNWPDFEPGDVEALPAEDVFTPPAPHRTNRGRYDHIIAQYEERVAQLSQAANMSPDRVRYGQLLNDASQFKMAIANLREAELIEPGTDVTFGYAPKYGFFTRIPPAIGGYSEPVRILAHTYRTDDPERIAWMRRLIREGADDNLVELDSHDLDAAVAPNGALIGWFPRPIVDEMRRTGAAKIVRTQ